MKRSEIIGMARQAWISEAEAEMLESDWGQLTQVYYEDLEKFAKIVAAKEREACAQICDSYAENSSSPMNFAENCAQSIRQRGKK
jgi:hypothetical protein